MKNIDNLAVDTLRVLSATMITKAKSGHPGICLGAAPIVHELFTNHLNLCPQCDDFNNRDRFVLSAGHGSALLYAALHISGYNLTMEDLKNLRQKGSNTPGHPEYGHTPGVEVTTGPLGQGLATAVGFAISEKHLAAKYNKDDVKLFDYNTYVLCGDGDLQEGLAMEAASIAGHLALNNLIVLFDSNDVQLDGPTELANNDDIKMKFEAMNWNYLYVADGTDLNSLNQAIESAKNSSKPTIIEIKTVIGHGSSFAGTSASHGKPLPEDELNKLRDNLGYTYPAFSVPNEVYELYNNKLGKRGLAKYNEYLSNLAYYKEHYSDLYQELANIFNHSYDTNIEASYDKDISTRKVAGEVLAKLANKNQQIIAGAADLSSSCMVKGVDGDITKDSFIGRNIYYGVREHAMGSIVNGITLSNLMGVAGGFFVFSDYMKDSIRQAALMAIPSLFIFSHDSVCVGEDGPTHEPVEQLTGLRAIPNLNVVRPCDANETIYALKAAVKNNSYPTVITTSRQNLPVLDITNEEGFNKGAYIVYEPKKVNSIVISCGTELAVCVEAAKELGDVRVVSMPSQFIFNQQSDEYKEQVLPKKVTKRLAVEMGSTMSWYRYASNVLGIDSFGVSMPISQMYEYYGFTKENIIKIIKEM